MRKIKNYIKSLILNLTVKFTSKNYILKNLLDLEEKEAIKQIKSGYQYNIGWWKSWQTKSPIDLDENPLPWVTYSFIDFIENRLTKNMIVFEYGSGNSTSYYASKVKEVHTVEHDVTWFDKVKNKMPNNVTINHEELEYGGNYSKKSSLSQIEYDVIIVDGRDRVNCMINSMNSLSVNGVLVLDDSEREAYKEGINKILENGFRKLDFWGVSPGLYYKKCTSIYYKTENIFNI